MTETTATPPLRPAFLTAGVSALLGLLVSGALVGLSGGTDGLASWARTSARAWLVAQGSGITVDGTSLGVVPWGTWVLVVGLVALVARWALARTVADVGLFAATVAGTSGVVAALVASGVQAGDVKVAFVRAAFAAFVTGGVGAAIGAASRPAAETPDAPEATPPRFHALWFTERPDVRAIVRASVWPVVVVLSVAVVIVIGHLVVHGRRAADLWALLDPGLGGGIVLALLNVLALPTVVLWTASALIGPGFAVGTDTSIDLTGSHLGALPGLPLLGALPGPGEFPGWVFVLGLVPLLGGLAAGWKVRVPGGVDPASDQALLKRVGFGAAAGAVGGLALGILVGLSGGGIGPGRLADAGPPFWTPLLVAVPVVAVGGALGAVLAHYAGTRADQPEEPSKARRPRLWKRHQSPGPDRRDDASDG